jgi:hypothetical protein
LARCCSSTPWRRWRPGAPLCCTCVVLRLHRPKHARCTLRLAHVFGLRLGVASCRQFRLVVAVHMCSCAPSLHCTLVGPRRMSWVSE